MKTIPTGQLKCIVEHEEMSKHECLSNVAPIEMKNSLQLMQLMQCELSHSIQSIESIRTKYMTTEIYRVW